MKILKSAFILLSIAFFIAACTQTETTKNTTANTTANNANTAPSTAPTAAPDETASGKKLFTEKCARCHKDDGSGGKTEIDGTTINAKSLISDHAKKDPDSEYVEAIEKGFPDDGMPAFKGKLSDQEIKDIIAYIRKDLQK